MRKFYLLLITALFTVTAGFGQTFTISNVYMDGDPMGILTGHASVTNNSASTKNVLVQRTVNNLFPGHVSYFCLVQCYSPGTSLANDTLPMPAGSTTGTGGLPNFFADLESSSIIGLSTVTYCFFDYTNVADSACIEFVYDVTTGFEELSGATDYLSKPYPNPASSKTNFYYRISAQTGSADLRITNALGAEIQSVKLSEREGVFELDLTGFAPGIYMYSLSSDGKTDRSGRFIVAGNLR